MYTPPSGNGQPYQPPSNPYQPPTDPAHTPSYPYQPPTPPYQPPADPAQAHGKSAAQVIIRWHLQIGAIVIPKAVSGQRAAENFDVFDFELSDSDMAVISASDKGKRVGADPATARF